MADLIPFIEYPGLVSAHSITCTDRHGITPSTMVLNILPQAGNLLAPIGDLTIGSGTDRRTWKDCAIDSTATSLDASGFIKSVTLLDRRWKWAYGSIEGYYNLRNNRGEIIAVDTDDLLNEQVDVDGVPFVFPRDPNNAPITSTERLPSQLCELLLRAMGEDTDENPAILEDVPNLLRPEVSWEGHNAAQELARLCDLLGCRIVLQPDDRVAIRVLGDGERLPIPNSISESISLPRATIPDRIEVVTAPTQYEWDFSLIPVVLDSDDIIKPMYDPDATVIDFSTRQNENVKIRPTDAAKFGWLGEHPSDLWGLAKPEHRQAISTAYRWYAIKFPVEDHPVFTREDLPTLEHITLVQRQASPSLIPFRNRDKPPQVYGLFIDRDTLQPSLPGNDPAVVVDGILPRDSKHKSIVESGFSVDAQKGIVQLASPLWRYGENEVGEIIVLPAHLKLRIGFYVKDRETRAFRRRTFSRDTGFSPGTMPLRVFRQDLLPQQWFDFTADVTADTLGPLVQFSHSLDNYNDLGLQADFQTKQIVDRIEKQQSFDQLPERVTYIGIVPTTLDGAIQSATYDISPRGVTTTLQRHQDVGSRFANSHDRMRQIQKLRDADSLLDKNRGKDLTRWVERTI